MQQYDKGGKGALKVLKLVSIVDLIKQKYHRKLYKKIHASTLLHIIKYLQIYKCILLLQFHFRH